MNDMQTGLSKTILQVAVNGSMIKINANVANYPDDFPTVNSESNVYGHRANDGCWTQSFWTGILWLAFELTGEEAHKALATKHTQSFTDRLVGNVALETHDIGFLYSLSCVADYRITGSELAKTTGIAAADKLLDRFKEKGEFIQAWGPNGDPDMHRLIIDCYMNLPLLYWATEVTGDNKYAEAATKHAHSARKVLLRENNSTFHTFYFDYETGAPTKGVTAQGYADDSCWSRGQAWGIYGMALSYKYTKDPIFIEEFYKIADYFIDHLPTDKVAYWDLYFTEGDEDRDSSAAAIAVCGILEMLTYLDDEKTAKYQKVADDIMASLIESYTSFSLPEANGLLLHGVYSKPGNRGVDEMMLWGDYYFMEALTRYSMDWKPYW